MRLSALLLTVLAAIPATSVAAQPVGETRRVIPLASAAARHANHEAAMSLTLWYPAAPGMIEQTQVIGPPERPLFRVADWAADAPPARGRRPVVLLSHGFGGSARTMGWLAAALARHGYIVVAVDHPGNSQGDMTAVGSVAWWERPRDMIAALSAVKRDRRFGPLIDGSRVAAAGFSIGGMTVLALAGARVDPGNYDRFCAANPHDGVCVRPAEMKDGPDLSRRDAVRSLGLASSEARAGEGTALPGLRAVVAIAPPTQELAQGSLGSITAPTLIVTGTEDDVVPFRNHGELAARAISRARVLTVPGAAHYSFLATCLDAARGDGGVCDHAPEQDAAHRLTIEATLGLLRRTLGSPDR